MRHLIIIFLLILIGNSLFITNVEASLIQTMEDPCNIIPGKWKGFMKVHWGKRCEYDGEFYGSLNNEIFELTGELSRISSSHPDCVEKIHNYVIRGTCKNGYLYAKSYSGYIYNDRIELSSYLDNVNLFR